MRWRIRRAAPNFVAWHGNCSAVGSASGFTPVSQDAALEDIELPNANSRVFRFHTRKSSEEIRPLIRGTGLPK